MGIIRNVKPATDAVGAPVLGLTNLDGFPSNTRMVFNRIQQPNPVNPPGFVDAVHDTATLQINNPGDQPLIISALTLQDIVNGQAVASANWQIDNPPALPATVAPGGTLALKIHFIAQSAPAVPYNETNDTATINGIPVTQAGGVWNGQLVITSNDPLNPTRTVQLAGYWQHTSENENEPGLQTIVNLLFGYQTNISNNLQPDLPNNDAAHQPTYYGEEVASAFWNAADPTQPVSVVQLDFAASQHQYDPTTGNPTAATLLWYNKGGGLNIRWVFQNSTGNGQTAVPGQNTRRAHRPGSFTPSGTFGWNLDGENSLDSANTTDINMFGRTGHAVRFYPVRDSAREHRAPNQWLMVMDYEGGQYDNSDFQDLVYLVSNMRPAASPPTPADVFAAPAPSGGVTIQWKPDSYGGSVGYDVYRASAPNGPFIKINPSSSSQTGFTDLNAPVGTTVYYHVVAVDLSTGAQSLAASAHAAAISAGTTPTGLPAPSSLLATVNADGSITVTWTPSPSGGLSTSNGWPPAIPSSRRSPPASPATATPTLDSPPATPMSIASAPKTPSTLSAYSTVATTTVPSNSGQGGRRTLQARAARKAVEETSWRQYGRRRPGHPPSPPTSAASPAARRYRRKALTPRRRHRLLLFYSYRFLQNHHQPFRSEGERRSRAGRRERPRPGRLPSSEKTSRVAQPQAQRRRLLHQSLPDRQRRDAVPHAVVGEPHSCEDSKDRA